MKFQDLGLSEPLLRAVEEKGYDTPTPIQQQAIPPVLRGRDLQGCAQTGTGKTAAFTLPILQLLAAEPPVRGRREIRALVLTPTRELAIQIDECCRDYARHLPIRHCVIFGGVNQRPQVEALQQGVDLLVATPGRLLDLIGQGYITLDHLRFFVLDEADRMLDMGFIHDIRRILPLLPARRQTLFFSATMPADIAALAARILHDPVLVAVTPPASVVETIAQRVHFAEKSEKSTLLINLLRMSDADQVLVFTRTKHGADKLARILNKSGIEAAAIHGNKSQNARVRAMNDFKSGACRVLIATDIAARGIDIDQLPLVINYELPEVAETYVHRIGRTGRAGHEGSAWSFCSEAELEYLLEIQRLTGLSIPVEGEVPEYAARALAESERKNTPKGGRKAAPKIATKATPASQDPKKELVEESGITEKTEKTGKPESAGISGETGNPDVPATSDEGNAPKKRRRKRRRGKGTPEGAVATDQTAQTSGISAAAQTSGTSETSGISAAAQTSETSGASGAESAAGPNSPAALPSAGSAEPEPAGPKSAEPKSVSQPESTVAPQSAAAASAPASGDKPRKRRRKKRTSAAESTPESDSIPSPATKETPERSSRRKTASDTATNASVPGGQPKTASGTAANASVSGGQPKAASAASTPETADRPRQKKNRTRNTPQLEMEEYEPKTGIERARSRQIPTREKPQSELKKQIPHTNDWKKRVKSLLLRSFRK